MQKTVVGFLLISLLGVGCTPVVSPPPVSTTSLQDTSESPLPSVDLPLKENVLSYLVVQKGFGMYVEDRFRGYHAGLDIEIPTKKLNLETTKTIPVSAMADGTVLAVRQVSGYGGVIVIKHDVDSLTPTAVYGHVDLSSTRVKVGDLVKRGDVIAFLGEDKTQESDGERQHLHFGLYDDRNSSENPVYIQGYESDAAEVTNWINPLDFFKKFGHEFEWREKLFSEFSADYSTKVSDQFAINFEYPETWSVEYIPSLNALNLYDLYGEGTARERSQIFIRYFDASDFLTLSTVTIHSQEDLKIGQSEYTARRYDIEKKVGIPNFPNQPSWRNGRHIVTDFRDKEDKTRYYVVAANPELDPKVYAQVLSSMKIE